MFTYLINTSSHPVLFRTVRRIVVVLVFFSLLGPQQSDAQATFDYTAGHFGLMEVEVPAQSDRLTGIIYYPASRFQGTVDRVDGAEVFVDLPAGNELFEPTEWGSGGSADTSSYAMLVESGPLEGTYFPVLSNGPSSLTVDPSGLSGSPMPAAGELISLVPYWTLETLFGVPEPLHQTASISGVGAGLTILSMNQRSTGNLENAETFYYFAGNETHTAGWRRIGGGFSEIMDDVPLAFGQSYILRNRSSISYRFEYSGQLPTNRVYVELEQPADGQAHLYAAANQTSIAMSLTGLKLVESGAVEATSSISGLGADRVFIFESEGASLNPSVSRIFYFYNGSRFGGSGWREVGGGFANRFDEERILQPGQVFAISRAPRPINDTFYLRYLAPYLSQ